MRLRLKDPRGIFYDPATGLRLDQGSVVEVSSVGRLTQEWLNSGGIVLVDEPDNPPVIPAIVITEEPAELSDATPTMESLPKFSVSSESPPPSPKETTKKRRGRSRK